MSSTLVSKVHAIYTSGNETSIHRMTTLLADALRDEDHGSLSALSDFLGLPVPTPNRAAAGFGLGLVQQARLFIDGENTHRVEAWISSYETSEPGSRRRLLYENILSNFVSAKREVAELKGHVKEVHALAIAARSKCRALTGLSRTIWLSCVARSERSTLPGMMGSIGFEPTFRV